LHLDCLPGVNYVARSEPELALLGTVGQLPSLSRLEVDIYGGVQDPLQWPDFIPPSLKALRIEDEQTEGPFRVELSHLLCAFPRILVASGARLERLEVLIPYDFKELGDGLVHLAQALRYSSPTLKGFLLWTAAATLFVRSSGDGKRADVERLRVQWADVLAGVSACRELQVLVLPDIITETLFPPGTAFGRLTHLEICDHKRELPARSRYDGAMGADGVREAARSRQAEREV
jgi:hypothetical protein